MLAKKLGSGARVGVILKKMTTERRNSWRSRMLMICTVVFVLALVFQMMYSSMSRPGPVAIGSNGEEAADLNVVQSKSATTTIRQESPASPPPSLPPPATEITCDRSHYTYDMCTIHVPTLLDPTTSTFFIKHSISQDPNQTVIKIRPHPRKWENFIMANIKELTITSNPPTKQCHVTHESPGLVFSVGGYTGNIFHEFNDGFIPLYITLNSLFYNQDNQDMLLVISKARDWWVTKYADLLGEFSRHPIINLDNDTSTHCFPSATLGLVSHGFMKINPDLMPNYTTLNHFHAFLSKAYGKNKHSLISDNLYPKPRVVLLSRPRGDGRALLNLEEVKKIVEEVGFDVIVFEPTPKIPLHEAFSLLNSSHAMIGMHGAALTHFLFLRSGAVFMQVVPLGTVWLAEACFGEPARAMGLDYMEYRIKAEESSLIEKYDKDDMVIKDPTTFLKGTAWSTMKNIYLKEQNVRLDLVRFRKYLKKAYKKAIFFMEKKG